MATITKRGLSACIYDSGKGQATACRRGVSTAARKTLPWGLYDTIDRRLIEWSIWLLGRLGFGTAHWMVMAVAAARRFGGVFDGLIIRSLPGRRMLRSAMSPTSTAFLLVTKLFTCLFIIIIIIQLSPFLKCAELSFSFWTAFGCRELGLMLSVSFLHHDCSCVGRRGRRSSVKTHYSLHWRCRHSLSP